MPAELPSTEQIFTETSRLVPLKQSKVRRLYKTTHEALTYHNSVCSLFRLVASSVVHFVVASLNAELSNFPSLYTSLKVPALSSYGLNLRFKFLPNAKRRRRLKKVNQRSNSFSF